MNPVETHSISSLVFSSILERSKSVYKCLHDGTSVQVFLRDSWFIAYRRTYENERISRFFEEFPFLLVSCVHPESIFFYVFVSGAFGAINDEKSPFSPNGMGNL
ncbi:MAG: hypothetical protein HXS41_07405 [Theionarchaea archaeon]|nr:hypothetical protein [Theionarchaea archaeon]MBU7000154.1 hypothetical protein [Theionarchaea archaeon]MBU7020871.1 hypothetical protein [Theionarchaea archaeon]MBU7034959.1 hypothetical protein [Theionarchaea archaeon]MBU7039187.1 hypothetical protein [Theionarchaea archaeon]